MSVVGCDSGGLCQRWAVSAVGCVSGVLSAVGCVSSGAVLARCY